MTILCFENQEHFVYYDIEGDIVFLSINIGIIIFVSVILIKIILIPIYLRCCKNSQKI